VNLNRSQIVAWCWCFCIQTMPLLNTQPRRDYFWNTNKGEKKPTALRQQGEQLLWSWYL